MSLKDKIHTVESGYYDDAFIRIINDHYYILRSRGNSVVVGEEYAYKFKNDFYGLLRHMNVLPKYWYAALRGNNLRTPTDSGMVYTLQLPDTAFIDSLYEVRNLTKRDLF